MSEELLRSQTENSLNYHEQINSILNRPLSPENVDSYADEALDSLITVARCAVGAYRSQPTINFTDNYSVETAAFSYFRLSDIGSILDFVSAKASEIHRLDTLIAQAAKSTDVLVPPSGDQRLRAGNGNGMKPKDLIPRLKTTLFILSNEFDIDLHDPGQITIIEGANNKEMVRDESYYYVEAPGLQRSFLICDEEGNASYIFDTSKLAEAGLDPDTLVNLAKPELNAFLQSNPGAGQRLVYSKNFVSNMLDAIDEPHTLPQTQPGVRAHINDNERQVSLRMPIGPAPEGFMTINSMKHAFGVGQFAVERAVRKLQASGELGDDTFYTFEKNHSFRGYSPQEQRVIYTWLVENGTFAGAAPDMFLSINGLGEFFNIAPQTVAKGTAALRELGVIGQERKYKFGPYITAGYSPEEQNAIFDWLKNNHYLVPLPPEGQLSIGGFSRWLGVTEGSTRKAVSALQEAGELDELPYYRFSGNRSQSLSPWEQNIVRDKLIESGILAPPAPEGCLSFANFAAACKVSPDTLRTVLSALEETGGLGRVRYYKFGTRSAPGYTLEQQATVNAYMKEHGVWAEPAPEGYLSLFGVSNEFGITRSTIQTAIDEIGGEKLGPVETYRFEAITTRGYSPAQQQRIREYLEQKGIFNPAPEGYRPLSAIAKTTRRDSETVAKAIAQLEETGELGETANYAFLGKALRGYSPKQQELIAATLLSYGVNPIERVQLEDTPVDYKTVDDLGELTGVAAEKIVSAAYAVDKELMGKVLRYKVGDTGRKAYSPEQQELIMGELEARGLLSPKAPADFLTFTAFRAEAKVSYVELRELVNGMSEAELGPVGRFRFEGNTNPALAYSPDQQSLILAKLAEKRAKEGWAPEGFESIPSLARQLGVGPSSIEKALQAIDPETLGPQGTYKFKTKRTIGLSPAQQELVKNSLVELGVLVPAAPEDVLTRNRIAKALGSNMTMVIKAVEALDAAGELGQPTNFRFENAPRPYRGFSREDQAKIKQWLDGHRRS